MPDTANKFQPDQKVRIDYTDAAGHRLFYEGRIVKFETNLKLWRVDIGSVSIAIPEENIHAIQSSHAEVQSG